MWTISTWTNIFCYLYNGLDYQKKIDSSQTNTARSWIFLTLNSNISAKTNFLQTKLFSLIIRDPGGFDSCGKKLGNKFCNTATLTQLSRRRGNKLFFVFHFLVKKLKLRVSTNHASAAAGSSCGSFVRRGGFQMGRGRRWLRKKKSFIVGPHARN